MIFINIGIDIGGSHTAMGLIDSNGSVLNSKEIFYTPQTFDIDECFEKYKIGLEKYRNTHKNYINQFKTYNYEPDSEDANFERKIEMKEILKKYNIYN